MNRYPLVTAVQITCSLLLQSSLKLQDDINNRSMKKLSEYVDNFEKIALEMKSKCLHSKIDSVTTIIMICSDSSSKLQAIQVRDLHSLLQQSHSSQKSKNIEFLLTVEQIVCCMQGGRLTSCKSGKDRTGMAVTLEQCCFLRNFHHLDSNSFNKALSTMRR